MNAIICKECGAKTLQDPEFGLVITILETDIGLLRFLFEKKLDHGPCDVCDSPLGIAPTIVVVWEQNQPIAVKGANCPFSDEQFFEKLQLKLRTGIEVTDSVDSLRGRLANQMKTTAQKFAPFFDAVGKDTLLDLSMRQWRELSPATFVVVLLAAGGAIPGIRIGVMRKGASKAEDQLSIQLATIQKYIWLGLTTAWAGDDPQPSFEADLEFYIDKMPIAPGSVSATLEVLDRLPSITPPTFRAHYCIEAVRASLCRRAQQENEHAALWAALFLGFEIACTAPDVEMNEKARAMIISPERARDTIGTKEAWDAAAKRLNTMLGPRKEEQKTKEQIGQDIKQLSEALAKAGHKELLGQILQDGMQVSGLDEISIEKQLAILSEVVKNGGSTDGLLSAARPFAKHLADNNRVDELEAFAVGLSKLMGESHESQARMEAWLGSFLKDLRMPERFLARIGVQERSWEDSLEPLLRAMLWTERSNALRLVGRTRDALEVARKLVELARTACSPANYRVAQRNFAILLREDGAPDAAVEVFRKLLTETEGKERLDTLQSLAVTYLNMGAFPKAKKTMEEGLTLATGPFQEYAAAFKNLLLTLSPKEDSFKQAVEKLSEEPDPQNLNAVVTYLSAWATILGNRKDLVPPDRFVRLIQIAQELFVEAKNRGDVSAMLMAHKLIATLAEFSDDANLAAQAWQNYVDFSGEIRQVPDPVALINLARYHFQAQEAKEAREILTRVPKALCAKFGAISNVALVAESTWELRPVLRKLLLEVIADPKSGAGFDDLRIVCEFGRATIGRAKINRRSTEELTDFLPTSDILQRLAPESGVLAVVESVDTGKYLGRLVTCISESKGVTSHWLPAPDVDEDELGKRLRNRLRNWRPSRTGDPFDLVEWKALEDWMHQALLPFVPDGSHIVFIEHEDSLSVPWHVAARKYWSASYASGWANILSVSLTPTEEDFRSQIGLALVPRFGETPEVLASLKSSADHARHVAAKNGLGFTSSVEGACDAEHLVDTLRQSDVLKLLCHGFVDTDGEVSLMVAHDYGLPLAHSVAAGTKSGQKHRLSWRSLQDVDRSPPTIFSAACSSGSSRLAGLGEHLGLLGALRFSGTRSLVAPRWDIVASEVLPILDKVFEQYVETPLELGRLLHLACAEAEKSKPRWIAWALALEGSWK